MSFAGLPRRLPLLLLLGGAAILVAVLPAGATTATLVVYPGPLEFINGTPGNLTFAPITLDGASDPSTSVSLLFDISDETGTAAGWRVEATSTQFSDASGNVLPADMTTIEVAPRPVCDANSTCVLAETDVVYPFTLPSGNSAIAATLFNAEVGTGTGAESVTPVFSLHLSSAPTAATYSSTWSFSLVSGP